jgi:hypothetical protein
VVVVLDAELEEGDVADDLAGAVEVDAEDDDDDASDVSLPMLSCFDVVDAVVVEEAAKLVSIGFIIIFGVGRMRAIATNGMPFDSMRYNEGSNMSQSNTKESNMNVIDGDVSTFRYRRDF